MQKNIILIGMPGAGKSTIGVVLAKLLGYDFLDVDIAIAKKAGKPLQEIINTLGVEAFLQLEEEAATEIRVEKTVIATGGSMVLSEKAMAHLKKQGVCVFLDVPLADLMARNLNMSTRGIAAEAGVTLEDIFHARQPYYKRYADMRVDCSGKALEQLAAEIAGAIL